MSTPRRHHYVPKFHQRRFTDCTGLLWVWDKASDRVFKTTPGSIAVESDFYRLHEYEAQGHDPFTLEKQLAEMEGQVSLITEQWLGWLRDMRPEQSIPIPDENREYFARFMAVQFLRTADTRDILCAIHDLDHPDKNLSTSEKTNLHVDLLWNQTIVEKITEFLRQAIWIFARNQSETPFWTSDNPIAFKTHDNSMWLKAGFLTDGCYAVYPLAPDAILYCHERKYWQKLQRFDNCLSPVEMTGKLVESDNTGQVFMAKRFVISSEGEFSLARQFAPTIGTDTYAPHWYRRRHR